LSEDNSIVKQDIIHAQQSFWAALKAKDAALFESILTDDFVSVTPKQPNESRAEFVRTLTSFPGEVESVDCDPLQVHLFGDVAVLTGIQIALLRLPNGVTVSDSIAITNVFRRIANGWMMVLAHPVELRTET
jgi:ketosteroid isomerase-like protein